MKPAFEWRPVLLPLYVKAYNPAVTTDDHFLVCVNPPREFREERLNLMREFNERMEVYVKAEPGSDAAKSYEDWLDTDFMPGINGWYARLLSHGEDKFTAEEIAEYGRLDAHFLNWLFAECIRMIDDHRSARKKN